MARKRIVCIKRGLKHEDPYRHISQVGIGEGAGFSEVLLVEEVTQQLQSPTGDRFYVHGSDGREAAGEAGAAVGGRAFSRAMGELAEGVIAPSQWEPGVDFSDVLGPDSAWFTGTSSRALPARPNTPTWEASPWAWSLRNACAGQAPWRTIPYGTPLPDSTSTPFMEISVSTRSPAARPDAASG